MTTCLLYRITYYNVSVFLPFSSLFLSGDNVAKKVGVCAEPEILHWDLTENDRFAIVASDGVFEFITSQNVVDMIAKFEDPIEGTSFALLCKMFEKMFVCDDSKACQFLFVNSAGKYSSSSFLHESIYFLFDHASHSTILIQVPST